ncbi:MAG: helix-turn-helix domain-containing protein [Kiritimatiellaeota bacterium]|nr:helix-turn-helix domain-containing protein [Kiritimatiellota bacterium]
MAFGEILKTAREQKGLSLSAVAESTHMKVQVIEDLEREDCHRIAAPIYGRGFIKLYAEFLELDPGPLIREFMDLYTGKRPPVVGKRAFEDTAEAPAPDAPLTRTVSDAAQRPEAPARPSVRAIESAAPDAEEAFAEPAPLDDAPVAAQDVRDDTARPKPVLVLEPEEPFADPSGEPDLFRPQAAADASQADAAEPVPRRKTERRPQGRIFDMDKHQSQRPVPEVEEKNAVASQRRHDRMRKFMEGINHLKATALGDSLPDTMFKQHRTVFIIGGVVLLVCMVAGIGLLFTMTGSKPATGQAPKIFETVAPLPDLYVD